MITSLPSAAPPSAPGRAATVLAAVSGVLGVAVLGVYFSQPLPLPPLNASLDQIAAFATRYHTAIFMGAWIQAIGTLLVVVFFMALVALAGAATRPAGLMTVLTSGALWVIGLVEVGASMAIPASVANGHLPEASAAYDFTNIFIHLIPIGPAGATYLALGVMLLGTRVLPRAFAYLALGLGAAFEIAGFLGLFDPHNPQTAITIILILQEVWVLAAAITVLIRARRPAPRVAPAPDPVTNRPS